MSTKLYTFHKRVSIHLPYCSVQVFCRKNISFRRVAKKANQAVNNVTSICSAKAGVFVESIKSATYEGNVNLKLPASTGNAIHMKPHIRNQRKRLDNTPWHEIIPRALLWADAYCRRYFAHIPSAPQPRDLLQQAITDFYSGNRLLPENEQVLPALLMVMKSIGSNFLDHHARVLEHQVWSGSQPIPNNSDVPSWLMDLEKLSMSLADDDAARRILHLKKDDPHLRARDLAALLNLSIHEIYNALKRLKRKIEVFTQL